MCTHRSHTYAAAAFTHLLLLVDPTWNGSRCPARSLARSLPAIRFVVLLWYKRNGARRRRLCSIAPSRRPPPKERRGTNCWRSRRRRRQQMVVPCSSRHQQVPGGAVLLGGCATNLTNIVDCSSTCLKAVIYWPLFKGASMQSRPIQRTGSPCGAQTDPVCLGCDACPTNNEADALAAAAASNLTESCHRVSRSWRSLVRPSVRR